MLQKSGGLYSSWGLAKEYGFTDVDGSQPDMGGQFDFEAYFEQAAKTPFHWTIARRTGHAPGERS